jgi:flavin-binding protein dodecin
MNERVYKLIEITGSSPDSLEDAIETAVAKAAETVRNMRWFEVVETRGTIKDGAVEYWQVTIKVGFTLEDKAGA